MRYLVATILLLMLVSCTEREQNDFVLSNDTIETTTSFRDSVSTNVIIVDVDVSEKIDIKMH